MYLLFGSIIALGIFFLIINFRRRKNIICKIRRMDFCEKIRQLNELILPFGFSYDDQQDILISSINAWQREFGYHALYNRMAPRFHMVFDYEPVYFDYNGRTWLIEFWKGQYGINTGAEIGIYYADGILSPDQYETTLFQSVPDEEMLPLWIRLIRCGRTLFYRQQRHWWLTGFCMGRFSRPRELEMDISIGFPNDEMLCAFMKGFHKAGYQPCDLYVCDLTASFSFAFPHNRQTGCFTELCSRLSQFQNQLFVNLFCRVTTPFTNTADRLLYLYYFLPLTFRRTIKIKSCLQKCARQVTRP